MLHVLAAIGRPNALDREVDAIASAALLGQSPFALVDPARAAAAAHLQQIDIPIWIVTIAIQIALLAWFWSSGWSARLRDRLRGSFRSEFLVRFLFGAALTLLDRLAALIPDFLQYRMTRIMDLSNDLTRVWAAGWIEGTIVAMIVAGLIAAIVLWLVDRTHQWYLYAIAGIFGFTLLVAYVDPFVIAPLHAQITPLNPPPALARDIAALRAKTGVTAPIVVISVGSRTHVGRAYVEGWGGSQRVVLSDTLLAGASEPELRITIAREFGWIAANTALHVALIRAAMLVLGVAIAVFVADRIGFRRDDDPLSRLALVGALLGCVYVIALPFYNGYRRNLTVAAQEYALNVTADRVNAIRLTVREADEDLRPLCPTPFAYWYFDSSQPGGTHISTLQNRPDVCATASSR